MTTNKDRAEFERAILEHDKDALLTQYGAVYMDEHVQAAFWGWQAARARSGPDHEDGHDNEGFVGGCDRFGCAHDAPCRARSGDAPVAFVPVHPRAGPLWPETYRAGDPAAAEARSPHYERMPLYTAPVSAPAPSFQQRVQPWMVACFDMETCRNRDERNHRFVEEALELAQANGCTQSEAHQLVDYVFGRPAGDLQQEVGGVMVTLAALCLACDIDMHAAGETELARIWTKIDAIRAKQATKPTHSPLPGYSAPADARDAGTEQPIPTPEEVRKDWCVVFCSGGVDLLALASDGRYRGLANIEDYADLVRLAALHLNTFIGKEPQPGYYICDMRSTVRGYANWWRPNDHGYTGDLAAAGIYEAPTKGYHDNDDHVPVPVEFAKTLTFRQMLDVGDHGNACMHSAQKLRAAIREWEQRRDFVPDDRAMGAEGGVE